MNEDQIDNLFQEQIQIKGIEKKAELTRQVIYNYRNRPRLSLGEKIAFLLKIDAITITKNEPETKP
jgi:hypothetical protein